MALQDIVEQTVTGMGYELVEIERSAGGLLRVTIDWPWAAGGARSITVDDCEQVTRQLQFALEVDAVDYRRLEVSSPGIDRPLRHERDFERFVGELVDITLKAPIGAAAVAGVARAADGTGGAVAGGPAVAANRKRFRGRLERVEDGGRSGWRIVWSDEPAPQPGRRLAKKRVPAPLQALDFTLDEVREARLAPIVDFKGRSGASAAAPAD